MFSMDSESSSDSLDEWSDACLGKSKDLSEDLADTCRDSTLEYLLADFGLATAIPTESTSFDLFVGDHAYMPLETLDETSSSDTLIDLRKIDIFSIGLVMFEMMTGMLDLLT